MAYDHEVFSAEVEHFTPPDDSQMHLARLQCCAQAQDAGEAEELWMMLGIHPSQEGVFEPVTSIPVLPIHT